MTLFVCLQDGQSRTIRQFQFTDWPEQGVPKSGEGFIDFIGQVHKTKEQFGQDGPISVHCRSVSEYQQVKVTHKWEQAPGGCFIKHDGPSDRANGMVCRLVGQSVVLIESAPRPFVSVGTFVRIVKFPGKTLEMFYSKKKSICG